MDAFKHHGVVPDVIDLPPKDLLSVTFDDSIHVKPGDVLTPTQVQHLPKLEWKAETDSYYTLIFTDPDAPSRLDPKMREWHHWVVVNVPQNKINEGETMTEFISSGPPPDTGLHRYIFLVFKQHGKQVFQGLAHIPRAGRPETRAGFSARNFAKEYNLGDLVAGNFYQAEFDDFVPKLYAEIFKQ